MRALAAALVLALLGALAWMLLRGAPAGAPSAGPARAVAPEAAAAPAPDVVGPAQDAPDSSRRAAPQAPVEVAQPAPEVGPDPARSGVLELFIADRDTGAGLEGARVRLVPEGEVGTQAVRWLGGPAQTSPLSAADGRTSYRVAEGVACKLWAWAPSSGSSTSLDVEPLSAGERRELHIELRTRADLRLWGRVVEAVGGAPLADARVSFLDTRSSFELGGPRKTTHTLMHATQSDPDGWFEGMAESWKHLHGRVEMPGYGLALFPIARGHETRERPLIVKLEPEAILRGHVYGAGDLAGLVVHVGIDGHELMQRHADSMVFVGELPFDVSVLPDGSWSLDGLPSNVRLALELRREHEVLQQLAQRLTLVPAEERVVDWRLGSGARIEGQATLAGSAGPAADVSIWLVSTVDAREMLLPHSTPAASTRTDANGGFTFEDVQPGSWRVGPAPMRSAWEPARDDDIAPLSQTLVVPEGARSVALQLTLHRGLFIEGEVRGGDGELARESYVNAVSLSESYWVHAGAEDGIFRVGPLAPGDYELTAHASGSDSSRSDEVTAASGATGVVLYLRAGGSIRGRMLEAASGDPIQGDIRAALEGAGRVGWTMTFAQEDGSFDFGGMELGSYTLMGRSGNLVGVLRGVRVLAGTASAEHEVSMSPGAELTVGYAGEQSILRLEVLAGGSVVASDALVPGKPLKMFLPESSYEVRASAFGDDPEGREWLREVALTLGQPTVLELDDEQR